MGRALYSRVTRTALLAALAVVGATVLGCGHSEEEMQAKQREIASLKSQLDAEQASSKKAQGELDDAKKCVEQLKKQLRKPPA
jgi:septal ring factor EnvC (AmiA/AmiB activator)